MLRASVCFTSTTISSTFSKDDSFHPNVDLASFLNGAYYYYEPIEIVIVVALFERFVSFCYNKWSEAMPS